jgi:hypothetical protein
LIGSKKVRSAPRRVCSDHLVRAMA